MPLQDWNATLGIHWDGGRERCSSSLEQGLKARSWDAELRALQAESIKGATIVEMGQNDLTKRNLIELLAKARAARISYLLSRENASVCSIALAKEARDLSIAAVTHLAGYEENNIYFHNQAPLKKFISNIFSVKEWTYRSAQLSDETLGRLNDLVLDTEKNIRTFILDTIIYDCQSSPPDLDADEQARRKRVVGFIESNREALIAANDDAMKLAVKELNSINNFGEISFRNYNKYAPWGHFFPLLTSHHLRESDRLNLEGDGVLTVPQGSAEDRMFFRVAAAACFASIALETDGLKNKLLKENFIFRLREIRREHNNDGDAAGDARKDDLIDACLCKNGVIAQFSQFGMEHTVDHCKIPPLDHEVIETVLRPYLSEKFRGSIDCIQDPGKKYEFFQKILTLSDDSLYTKKESPVSDGLITPELLEFCSKNFPLGNGVSDVFHKTIEENPSFRLLYERDLRPAFNNLYLQYATGYFGPIEKKQIAVEYYAAMIAGFNKAVVALDGNMLAQYIKMTESGVVEIDINKAIDTPRGKLTPLEYAAIADGKAGVEVVRLLCNCEDVQVSPEFVANLGNSSTKIFLDEKFLAIKKDRDGKTEAAMLAADAKKKRLEIIRKEQDERNRAIRARVFTSFVSKLMDSTYEDADDIEEEVLASIRLEWDCLDFNSIVRYQKRDTSFEEVPMLVYAIRFCSPRIVAALAEAPGINRNTLEIRKALVACPENIRKMFEENYAIAPFDPNELRVVSKNTISTAETTAETVVPPLITEGQRSDGSPAQNPLSEQTPPLSVQTQAQHPPEGPRHAYGLMMRLFLGLVRWVTGLLSALGWAWPEDALNRRYPEYVDTPAHPPAGKPVKVGESTVALGVAPDPFGDSAVHGLHLGERAPSQEEERSGNSLRPGISGSSPTRQG